MFIFTPDNSPAFQALVKLHFFACDKTEPILTESSHTAMFARTYEIPPTREFNIFITLHSNLLPLPISYSLSSIFLRLHNGSGMSQMQPKYCSNLIESFGRTCFYSSKMVTYFEWVRMSDRFGCGYCPSYLTLIYFLKKNGIATLRIRIPFLFLSLFKLFVNLG